MTDRAPASVLIIGAGAVGLVYAKHLADGGASVSLFVRPKRRTEAEAGYVLTRARILGARTSERFVPKSVVTSVDEVRSLHVDQAWIATSTGTLDEPWLQELLGALPNATIVFLQPGEDAATRMRELVPDDARRVRGAISMASWATPLEGSRDPRELRAQPGIAYLLPPFGPTTFEGARAREIAVTLSRGGCPATVADVTRSLAISSSILLPHVVALEAAGWRFARLASREIASLAARASREALAIACAGLGARPPFATIFVRPIVTQIAALLARARAPFDVETYFRVHFLKVRDQTDQLIGESVSHGRALRLPTENLEALHTRVFGANAKNDDAPRS